MRSFNQQAFQPLDTFCGGLDVNFSLGHFPIEVNMTFLNKIYDYFIAD